jgi:hypothetical protein
MLPAVGSTHVDQTGGGTEASPEGPSDGERPAHPASTSTATAARAEATRAKVTRRAGGDL